MKLTQSIIIIISLLIGIQTSAAPYDWQTNRLRYTLTEEDTKLPELKLKHYQQVDYSVENDQFIMLSTYHSIVWVNSEEAISRNNRIYIPMTNAFQLVSVKARTITKDGKVVDFDQSNLKEVKDDEYGNSYKIFAIEGVELGSEIEYFYTKKTPGRVFDRFFFQIKAPIKEAALKVSIPKHLQFDFKGYHGVPIPNATSTDALNIYTIELKDIAAAKNEEFSFFDSNRKRVEYKLAYNTARSKVRMYTWDEAAKTFYKVLSQVDAPSEKALNKFVTSLKDKPTNDLAKRIKDIESKIKTSIQVNENSGDPALDNIASIIKYKVASPKGITQLMFLTYQKLGIKVFPIITCSREKIVFDENFDSWGFLDEYFLYFPEIKSYLSPKHFETRVPIIPAEFTAQKGLLLEIIQMGELRSALANIQEIPALDYTANKDNLTIKVDFNDDLTENIIDQQRTFSGINAIFFAPYYALMSQEEKQKMIEEIVKQTAPDVNVSKWDAQVLEENGFDNFVMNVNYSSNHFIEIAGNKILFKAGELIGPQSELYQEESRTNDIENEYNRGYDRIIEVKIPEGYIIKNPESINFNVVYEDGQEQPFLFKSSYIINGNILRITINEYYKMIKAPVARYEEFRKVINAAADFNKVTLVLEKQ